MTSTDIHHIKFLSMGGSDDIENLAAICPACHRTLAHQIYGFSEVASIQVAVRRGRELRRLEAAILQSRTGDSAATALLSESWRAACLAQGAYERTVAWCDYLLARPNELNPVSIVRLQILRADMLLYCSRSTAMLPLLLNLRSHGPHEPAVARALAFTAARYLHELGDYDRERDALSDLPGEPSAESKFRMISANARNLDHFAITDSALADDNDVMIVGYQGNAEADVGRHLVAAGDLEAGYAKLEWAWSLSKKVVHRRGMLITGIKLAEVSIQLAQYDLAATWLKLAAPFNSAGVAHEISPSNLIVQIYAAGHGNALDLPLRMPRGPITR